MNVEVKQGWSGQTSTNPDRWAKTDVKLDENDLRRLLVAAQIDLRVQEFMPIWLCYQLLEIEAEILIYAKLIGRYGYPAAEGQATIAELRKQKAGALAKVAEITR